MTLIPTNMMQVIQKPEMRLSPHPTSAPPQHTHTHTPLPVDLPLSTLSQVQEDLIKKKISIFFVLWETWYELLLGIPWIIYSTSISCAFEVMWHMLVGKWGKMKKSSYLDKRLGKEMWLLPKVQAFTGVFTFQVMSEGGPQPQSIIHFSISNQTVAVVNRRGQVTGKVVGRAVVHGTIQTVNEDTGKVIVFSQVLVLCSALLLLLHLGITGR